jgi:hypothetical protein
MSRNRHKRSNEIGGRFVAIKESMLDTPAWRASSHGARSLYLALKRRYSWKLRENDVYASMRELAEELGSHHEQIARWFREEVHYGFLRQISPGSLGVEGRGRSPHWRFTELGYKGDLPTNDFLRWNGQRFKPKAKIESRGGKPPHGVAENRHTESAENRHTKPAKCGGKPAHEFASESAENPHISRISMSEGAPRVRRIRSRR